MVNCLWLFNCSIPWHHCVLAFCLPLQRLHDSSRCQIELDFVVVVLFLQQVNAHCPGSERKHKYFAIKFPIQRCLLANKLSSPVYTVPYLYMVSILLHSDIRQNILYSSLYTGSHNCYLQTCVLCCKNSCICILYFPYVVFPYICILCFPYVFHRLFWQCDWHIACV